MSDIVNPVSTGNQSWARFNLRLLAIALIVAIGVGWMAIRSFVKAVESERNLHATTFVVRLVERFVSEQGRWPSSWAELESLRFDQQMLGEDWPKASAELQQRVSIDFHAAPQEIAHQAPMTFSAIKPIEPCFEYRDYGYVPNLQTTLRKILKAQPKGEP